MKIFRSLHCLLALTIAVGGVAPAAAQTYPNKPIKIIVGYAPGGTTDIIARLIATRLSATLGQSVIVENRPGAGGNLGADAVAKSAPDGYTLQLGTAGNMTINPSIYPNMPFDTVKDFQAISMIAALPNLMVVNPAVPAKTVQEFVAWAKARSGKVFFASSGTGNSPHMTAELFNLATGLSMVHVPYRGSGPALVDLIGGQGVQVMFDNMPSAIGFARNGSLRAIAVSGPTRSSAAPELPTVRESGYPDFEVMTWFGLFAPARTPSLVIDRLHKEVVAALRTPELQKQLTELGAQPVGNTPDEFSKVVEADVKRWATVVKAAHIQAP